MTLELVAVVARAGVLVVAGTGLGLVCNALRSEDRIELGRHYFTAADRPVEQVEPPERVGGFVVVSTDRAIELLAEAKAQPERVVFVDARDGENFAAGHIPGAVKVDYYNAASDLHETLARIAAATVVVVYCGSNECDDAELLCRELRDVYAVEPERIVLYLEGMRGWEARGHRVAREG